MDKKLIDLILNTLAPSIAIKVMQFIKDRKIDSTDLLIILTSLNIEENTQLLNKISDTQTEILKSLNKHNEAMNKVANQMQEEMAVILKRTERMK